MKEPKTQKEFDKLAEGKDWIYVSKGYWEASGSAHVEARGSAHIEARGSAHIVARESAHVVARESVYIVARGSAHVEAWGSSTCAKHSSLVNAHGNVIDFTIYPKTVDGWLNKYECPIRRGKVILYKATDENYRTRNGFQYTIGEMAIAPDWEDIDIECGKGLHLCHHPVCCKEFITARHYLACEVKVIDLRIYSSKPEFPDKLRAKSCRVLYEVDRWGNKIEVQEVKL